MWGTSCVTFGYLIRTQPKATHADPVSYLHAMAWDWTYSGILSLVLGLFATAAVAWWVYVLQGREQTTLTCLVSKIDGAVSEIAEMLAEQQQQEIVEDIEDIEDSGDEEPNRADGDEPANKAAYVDALKARGIALDYDALRWKRKKRFKGEGRGNLGWFVDNLDGRRYFVHHGNRTVVRQAIPRDLLDAWKAETGKDSQEIELDYQTGRGPGNHAWFVRTYDGDRWRITKGKGSVVVTSLDRAPE